MYNASSFPDKQEDNAESVLNSLMQAALRLALYEPDIPQNTGAILRTAVCMGVAVDIIEPCGFVLDDRKLRRAGMDYIDYVDLTCHAGWPAFQQAHVGARRVLLTTKAAVFYTGSRLRPATFCSWVVKRRVCPQPRITPSPPALPFPWRRAFGP